MFALFAECAFLRVCALLFASCRCVIFMDEVDAIGGRRFSQGTSADREIQRTLMELLNQLDGFDDLGQVKMVMATNRPDTLDPALLRPGRLDRKIEIPLPNEANRLEILKIHAASIAKHGDIDYEAVVKLADGFNGADLRNVTNNTRGHATTHAGAGRTPRIHLDKRTPLQVGSIPSHVLMCMCTCMCVCVCVRCARRPACLPFVWSALM